MGGNSYLWIFNGRYELSLDHLCDNISNDPISGVVAQQMLVLPYNMKTPIVLPFRTTHLFLVGTRSSVQPNVGLSISPLPNNASRTLEERKEIARRVVSSLVDPKWNETNGERFEFIFKRAVNPAM